MKNQARRILLADDFEVVRRVMRTTLEEAGLTAIDEAGDGTKALAMIKAALASGAPYALVFCDWNMPGLTGIQVLDECRKIEGLEALPFVMVTAESEEDSVTKALQAGATDYVIKPVTPDVLQRKALRMLSRSGL